MEHRTGNSNSVQGVQSARQNVNEKKALSISEKCSVYY